MCIFFCICLNIRVKNDHFLLNQSPGNGNQCGRINDGAGWDEGIDYIPALMQNFLLDFAVKKATLELEWKTQTDKLKGSIKELEKLAN